MRAALKTLIPGLVISILSILLPAAPALTAESVVTINGAGATFPFPLYSKWFSEYRKIDPSVEINYQSIGSGGGIRQLLDKTVDFGASDAPMTNEQLAKSTTPILHIPTVLGAVVITYNLPEVKAPLTLTGEMIADIFLGKITQWDDPRILALNPSASLPKGESILVMHRSDGSGTTNVFADYLSKVSPEWKQKVGAGTALNWPAGLGGKGNEGVTELVKQSPGSIGYVELTFAESNKLPFASLRNQAGKVIVPSPQSVELAAASVKEIPDDFRVSITNAPGAGAYPISSFTYLLVYAKMSSPKGEKLSKFIRWALTSGEKLAGPLFYAQLPSALVGKVEARLKRIQLADAAG